MVSPQKSTKSTYPGTLVNRLPPVGIPVYVSAQSAPVAVIEQPTWKTEDTNSDWLTEDTGLPYFTEEATSSSVVMS